MVGNSGSSAMVNPESNQFLSCNTIQQNTRADTTLRSLLQNALKEGRGGQKNKGGLDTWRAVVQRLSIFFMAKPATFSDTGMIFK